MQGKSNDGYERYLFDCFVYNAILACVAMCDGEMSDFIAHKMKRLEDKWGVIPTMDMGLPAKQLDAICRTVWEDKNLSDRLSQIRDQKPSTLAENDVYDFEERSPSQRMADIWDGV